MEFDTARVLLIVGFVFMLLPGLGVVGAILLLVAFYGLSRYFDRRDLFENALYFAVVFIFGVVLLSAMVFVWWLVAPPGGAAGAMVTLSVVGAVVVAISAFLYWRVFVALAEASGVNIFKTGGLLVLVGGLASAAALVLLVMSPSVATTVVVESVVKTVVGYVFLVLAVAIVGGILWIVGHVLAVVGALGLRPPARMS
ncbi:MAG: DUF996 domain-containing protein [Pyrobaculum sp.]